MLIENIPGCIFLNERESTVELYVSILNLRKREKNWGKHSQIRKFLDYKIWQITKFLYFASSQIWKLPNIKISIFCIMPNMEIVKCQNF